MHRVPCEIWTFAACFFVLCGANKALPTNDCETAKELYPKKYADLFRTPGTEELRRLVSDVDSGLALAAGWERVRLSLPAKETEDIVRPDKALLMRFLGLVEGRTQVPIPSLWEDVIESTGSYGRQDIWFPLVESAGVNARGEPVEDKHFPRINCDGNTCVISCNGFKWLVPVDDNQHNRKVAVEITEEHAYIALFGFLPCAASLYGIEKATGKVIWSASVCGDAGLVNFGGGGLHVVQLRSSPSKVVVFGMAGHVAYIECFDSKTGKNIWRFSTAYFKDVD